MPIEIFIIITLIIFLLIIVIVNNSLKSKLTIQIQDLEQEKSRTQSLYDNLVYVNNKKSEEFDNLKLTNSDLNEKLNFYSPILNVEAHAKIVFTKAEIEAEKIVSDAKIEAEKIAQEAALAAQESLNSNKEAKNLLQEARIKLKKAIEESNNIVIEAINKNTILISDAEQHANSISENAYEALKQKTTLEKTIISLKNLLNGYGDQYIIPAYSILDQLAEEYGFDDCGVKLKKAREYSALLVTSRKAAFCEYVEKNRRDAAENFVIDAFNGKVDSILSTIKNNNYGTLQQKIKDAFHHVNNNGSPFRNAKITELYLNARLDELKWVCAVHQLRLKEKDEQRRINEQIREEEKARKEYERAMKEAAKEEEYLKNAIIKAKQEIEKAKAEEREKYETKLLELNNKLTEAEEKNRRALSMAQQTKTGHVYVISNIGSFGENVFKIGMTRRLEPMDRVKELGDASVPFPFDVHAMIFSENAPQLEKTLHKKFLECQLNKVNPRKEFFKTQISEIKTLIETLGIEVFWTISAKALEYRESLVIEQQIKADDKTHDIWVSNQEKQIDTIPLNPTERSENDN